MTHFRFTINMGKSDKYGNSRVFDEVSIHQPKSHEHQLLKKSLQKKNNDSDNNDNSVETGYEKVEEVIRADASCQFPSMSAYSQPPPLPPRRNRTSILSNAFHPPVTTNSAHLNRQSHVSEQQQSFQQSTQQSYIIQACPFGHRKDGLAATEDRQSRGRGRREEDCGYRYVGRQSEDGRKRSKERYPSYNALSEEFAVKIISGELAKTKADVIVNSEHYTLDLSIGTTSNSLLKAGGQQLQDECQTKFPNGVSQGQFVITKGGQLKCSQVYHGILKSWDQGRRDALDEFVYDCLNTASKNKLTSIAFPALGTGKLGYPAEIAAEVMLKCAYKFHRKNPTSSLTTIYIVVFHKDTSTLQAFRKAESKVEEEGKTRSHDIPESSQLHNRGENKDVTEKRRSTAVGVLDVQIQQGDITKESVDVIVNSVGEHLDLSKGALSKAILKAAGNSIQEECKRGAQHMKSDAFIVTSPGNMSCKLIIHVKAQKTANGWRSMVSKVLTYAEKCGYQSIAFPALGTGAQACDPEDVAKAMFDAMRNFSTDKKLKFVRVIVFQENMVRIFASTLKNLSQGIITKIEYKVSARSNIFGTSDCWPWMPMKPGQIVIEVTLKEGDAEYEEVKSHFMRSSKEQVPTLQINRVQNPTLYAQYTAKRTELLTRNESDPERWLWHGTSAGTVDKITSNGFNRSYSGKNGTAYGNGVYFAVNSSYSVGYCQDNRQGPKHMFLAQVLTGDSCQGRKGMNVLPQKEGDSKNFTYDSATDNLTNPNMFVIFHDSQAYPTYHIIFN